MTKQATVVVAKLTKQLETSLASMDLAKMTQIMERFEDKVEDVEVVGTVVEESMQKSTATMVSQDDVDELISIVASENDLELKAHLPEVATGNPLQR